MTERDQVVLLAIVETIHYSADFTVGELSDLCMKHGLEPYDPTGETGDLLAWLQDEASEALRLEDQASNVLSEIEHDSGDVQGQEWTWEVATNAS